jgi:hypothetical protein
VKAVAPVRLAVEKDEPTVAAAVVVVVVVES